jgi:uncharacterized lipoprotein YbaY
MKRLNRIICIAIAAAVCAGGLLTAAPAQAQVAERCFPETGQCIAGRIRQYWEQNGGLAVFGYPISAELTEEGFTVQYFERQRLELHPELAAPYDVLLGRLGAEVLASNGIVWQDQPASPGPREGCRWFPETRHNVCDQQPGNGFLTAWRTHGLRLDSRNAISEAESLALFGLPITEVYEDTIDGKPVQFMWFERARFEWHPDNPAAYRVLFGRLGAEIKGAPLAAPLPSQQAPNATPLQGVTWRLASFGAVNQQVPAVAGAESTIMFDDAARVNGTTGCNGFGGSYTASSNQIAFGQVVSTLRACDEPVAAQEREVLAALQGTVRYEISGSTLQLFYNQEQSILTYKEATPTSTSAAVTGTVTYRERIALPSGAIVTVRLLDTARQEAAAPSIAEQTITTGGEQVPIAFKLTYDTAQINPNGSYAVRADIRIDGQLTWTTADAYLVITQGHPSNVELVLQRVVAS